jgi:hypothetical protein
VPSTPAAPSELDASPWPIAPPPPLPPPPNLPNQVPGGDILYDPRSLAPEWRAWLTKTRAAPPTPEELAAAEARAAAMAARVAAVEAREAARRFRTASLGREDAGGPDLAAFTAQLGSRGYGGGGGRSSGGAPAMGPSGGGSGSPGGAASPGGSSSVGGSSDGSGGAGTSGNEESFKPGVRQPGEADK